MSVDKPKNARRLRLFDFAIAEFLPGKLRLLSRAKARVLMTNVKATVKAIRELLDRRPIVNDLNPDTFAKLKAAKLPEEIATTFVEIWRCAYSMAIVDLPFDLRTRGAKRSDHMIERETPEGTLWRYCVEVYFQKNARLKSQKTRDLYAYAMEHFARYLGHDPTTADLDDDIVSGWAKHLLESGLSPFTVREKVGRITALWRWMAKRDRSLVFPTIYPIETPDPEPVAFTQEQLAKLFKTASQLFGQMNGVSKADWWMAWLAFVWSTGERFGAAKDLHWEWIDFANNKIVIPAHVRKGGKKRGVYDLWPEVAELLKRLWRPGEKLVFDFPFTECTYYNHYSKLLRLAGLPGGRKRKTQGMRVSHATWREVLGGDATKALMHGDRQTTEKHYLDPAFAKKDEVKLPAPWLPQVPAEDVGAA